MNGVDGEFKGGDDRKEEGNETLYKEEIAEGARESGKEKRKKRREVSFGPKRRVKILKRKIVRW